MKSILILVAIIIILVLVIFLVLLIKDNLFTRETVDVIGSIFENNIEVIL